MTVFTVLIMISCYKQHTHSSLHSFTHLVCYSTWGHRQQHDTVPDLKKPQPFAGNDIITAALEVLIKCEPNVEEIWR